jgi:maintenance of morphology protein 1
MSNGYLLSLHLTFTQGLILGQLSVLVLLVLILKYLFLDSTKSPFETSSYHPPVNSNISIRNLNGFPPEAEGSVSVGSTESMEWFNLLVQQVSGWPPHADSVVDQIFHKVVETFRSGLRDNVPGADGDEIARKRIEDLANAVRPPALLVRLPPCLDHLLLVLNFDRITSRYTQLI